MIVIERSSECTTCPRGESQTRYTKAVYASASPRRGIGPWLALRELELAAGAALAVLLALLGARVARQEAAALQRRAQVRIPDLEGARDPVPGGARLAGDPAAVDPDLDRELPDGVRGLEVGDESKDDPSPSLASEERQRAR